MGALRLSETHHKLSNDFRFYSKNAPLIITTKEGKRTPLVLNKAQLILHNAAEQMQKELGYVRMLVSKGRQQGCSTYIGARFFWKTTRNFGMYAYVMAHDFTTTDKLFKMTKRYYENVHPSLKPHTNRSNVKELDFSKLDSQYYVGTAGSKSGGRGGTLRLFHGSEVAFWNNHDDIRAGVMQSISESKGSEVYLESTSNGYDPMFYPMVMDAIQKKGKYRFVFIPWYIQEEYRNDATDLIPTDEEQELIKTYNLDLEQIAFRRNKIIELKSEKLFKQEYPFTVHESFQVSGDSFFSGVDIENAAQRSFKDFDAPRILGVDPATEKDRLCYVLRQGRSVPFYKSHNCSNESKSVSEIIGEIINLGKELRVDAVIIDLGEVGKGIYDILLTLDLPFKIYGIRFQQSADDENTYANKRAEMYCLARDHIKDSSIPNDPEFKNDFMAIPDYKPDARGRILFPKKEEIKKKFGFSPDLADAYILTFAVPIKPKAFEKRNITFNIQGFSPS